MSLTEPRHETIAVSGVLDILRRTISNSDIKYFRGQSDASWPLIPRLFRLFDQLVYRDTWDRIEGFILDDFEQYAVPYLNREPKSKFEWMATGQHYGLPTRLLDWSTNPLKATYFAVNEYVGTRDGAVFAFVPEADIPYFTDRDDIDGLTAMYPVVPPMIDTRIIAQDACFTVSPLPQKTEPFTPLDDPKSSSSNYYLMIKFVISMNDKFKILKELNRLGINEKTLFPDLAGLARYLAWRHQYRTD